VDAFDTSASANFNQSGMGNRRRRGACPHASFWLDLRIALHTLIFIFTGERRFEQAVRDANEQRNGHYKPQIIANRGEPREITPPVANRQRDYRSTPEQERPNSGGRRSINPRSYTTFRALGPITPRGPWQFPGGTFLRFHLP